ncbi:MAG TPA: putative oxidoreductase C-terminal domain-containing protein [Blastocatellia bacterium]|nr:putative oxidoreductase C-terminal domain-containing protein [Blastocatellia bacterium]
MNMLTLRIRLALVAMLMLSSLAALIERPSMSMTRQDERPMPEVRLITLDPGHFHAALVQKRMHAGMSNRVEVYAPLGFDLTEHMNRIARFNTRQQDPTAWELDVRAGPDFFERMLKERRGNVVVISGRNRGKIDRLKACVEAGLNALADKPWIITPADLPKLEASLATADRKGLVAYDMMTERYEITTMLQRELINDDSVFGSIVAGTEQAPGVFMESVHNIMKTVAGVPNLRPAWFFDVNQQGEGLADTGTHLVDLAQWMLFPERAIDYRKDVNVIAAKRWPTAITRAEFRRVTGETDFPEYLRDGVRQDQLDYYCNGQVAYELRGVHVTLKVVWDYEAPAGAGDTHFAVFKGSKSRIEVRQGKEEKYRPELYVVPDGREKKPDVLAALKKKVEALQAKYPGLAVEDLGERLRVAIPDKYRVGHEEHFAQVTDRFLQYFRNPGSLPSWEKANMLAKYYVTTKAVELSRH